MSHDPRLDLTLRDMRKPLVGIAVIREASRYAAATMDRLSREVGAASNQTPLWAWAVSHE